MSLRAAVSTIKQAILHPEQGIRYAALDYFSRRFSPDDSLMPLVIQAVNQFGRETAVGTLRLAESLVQTPETVQWLQSELDREYDFDDVAEDNYRMAIALILLNAPVELLSPGIAQHRNFPEELRESYLLRLEMVSWPQDKLWRSYWELGEEIRDSHDFSLRHLQLGGCLAEALARQNDHAEDVLALVRKEHRGWNENVMRLLDCFTVELAGRMRLEEAVPAIVKRLHSLDDVDEESAATALARIGGDRVVRAISEEWPDASSSFRWSAAGIMGSLSSDLAAEKCLEWVAAEEDEDVRSMVACAALNLFTFSAVEPVAKMVVGHESDLDEDLLYLRYYLVAVATIMQTTFPNYEQWYREAQQDLFGITAYNEEQIREDYSEHADADEWYEGWEDEEDDDRWEDLSERHRSDLYKDFDDDADRLGAPDRSTTNWGTVRKHSAHVGRNDPCPCGSGRKYKKCCLKRESEP